MKLVKRQTWLTLFEHADVVFDLIDGLTQMLLGEETLFDDTSAPITLIAKYLDISEVGNMLGIVHVFGQIRVSSVLPYCNFVFFHSCVSISCCFTDIHEITVLTRHLVDDLFVLLGFI